MYSPEFEIDTTRLHQKVAERAEVFAWSNQRRQFDKVQFAGDKPTSYTLSPSADSMGLQIGGQSGHVSRTANEVVFHNNDGRQGIQLSDLNLNPLNADFAAIEMKTAEQNASLTASFAGKQTDKDQLNETLVRTKIHTSDNSRFQTVYVPLSRHWKWFQTPSIETIFLRLPPGHSVVKSIKLLAEKECCPEIAVLGKTANENGVFELAGSNELQLNVDGSSVKEAATLVCGRSAKPISSFDNFRESEGADAVDKKISLSQLSTNHELKRSDFWRFRSLSDPRSGSR